MQPTKNTFNQSATLKPPIKSPNLAPSPLPIPEVPTSGGSAPPNQNHPELMAEAISLSFNDVDTLARILGKNIFTPTDLIDHCRQLTRIKVGGVDVILEPGLMERVHSRSGGMEFTEFVNQTVKSLLAGWVGW